MEQYFCWKTPPRGPLKWKKCLLMPDPGSPGTGSLLAHGACPALGGRLGLIAKGAAFFLVCRKLMVGGAVMKINEGALPGRLAWVLTDAVLRQA